MGRESELQTASVRWFRLAYPRLAGVFFAVPNGGSRNAREARNMKAQGTMAGVSDLILLKSSGGYGALCIEMKAGKNGQTEYQRMFEQSATEAGNKYVVCRSFDEFRNVIENYLHAGSN